MADDFTFKAIGTTWSITTDSTPLSTDVQNSILGYIAKFEARFSRFLPDSEVNQFRSAVAESYQISEEFATLLAMADRLRILTNGVYDPAAGELLERAGYDSSYRLKPKSDTETFTLPHWILNDQTLTLDGPTAFDLGGIGKGYCIDIVASLLTNHGYRHFLVNAGGDMYGTSKHDSSPWRIAIEYPGKPDTAAGVINLKDQSVTVSDSFRRRWGKWHHLVDPKRKQSIEKVIGAVAVTSSAWYADCMTSVLFLASPEQYPTAAQEFNASYLVFNTEGTCLVSPQWKGELF